MRRTKMDAGDDGVERVVDSKDMQQLTKTLDKLTDRVEDRQLDSTRVQESMASIAASKEADIRAARLREKELAAVNINVADVDIIANELDKKEVERTLREHKGDAVASIQSLLYQQSQSWTWLALIFTLSSWFEPSSPNVQDEQTKELK